MTLDVDCLLDYIIRAFDRGAHIRIIHANDARVDAASRCPFMAAYNVVADECVDANEHATMHSGFMLIARKNNCNHQHTIDCESKA